MYHGDVNTGFTWACEGDSIVPVAKEGKGGILHRVLTEKNLVMGIPSTDQWTTPTSRPRQEGRQGQCIDVMCYRGIRCKSFQIHEDSYMMLGTDHEMCHSEFVVQEKKRRPRYDTKPRVWVGGVAKVDFMDQACVEHLARRCAKPAPGHAYRDTAEIKKAFRDAKRSGGTAQWKQALKLRKEARKKWEQDRLLRASQGDWGSFRALRPQRQEGWDVAFAEAQQGDPHEAVHAHLSQVYDGQAVEGLQAPWKGGIRAFTVEELRKGVSQMKRGKAVGVDRTSTELLLGLMEVEGGFNRILTTQSIPKQWNKPILIMLPKIRAPKKAKELRPIAMGSAVSKLFSRLLLNRALPALAPCSGAQCSMPGRQTCDYLFTVIRLFELAREWGVPLTVFKLDLEKAFDSLDRTALLQRLQEALGEGAEMGCWRGLLRGTVGQLQTPWGSTEIHMRRGMKQGAVESPTMFAWIAELAMHTAVEKYGWRTGPRVFEEMLYMDDGMLWSSQPSTLQVRAGQLAAELAAYGLKLNPGKCQLYASDKVLGDRFIRLSGTKVEAAHSLEVMGLSLRVGMSVCELAAPLASRARSKFWENKQVFRSRGGSMKQRARVLQRVVGSTALWCICCLPPDAATMTMLNSVQLQLMVWMLRFARRAFLFTIKQGFQLLLLFVIRRLVLLGDLTTTVRVRGREAQFERRV